MTDVYMVVFTRQSVLFFLGLQVGIMAPFALTMVYLRDVQMAYAATGWVALALVMLAFVVFAPRLAFDVWELHPAEVDE